MTNTWHRALKEWNAGQPAWCMPKRGTEEHKQVKAIQQRLDREGRVPAPNPARLSAVREKARATAERAMAYDPYPALAPEPIVEAPAQVVAPPVAVVPPVAVAPPVQAKKQKKKKLVVKKSAPKLQEELEYFRLVEEYHELKDTRAKDGKLKWKGITEFVRPYLEVGLTHEELSIKNFGKGQGFVIRGNCRTCNNYTEAGEGGFDNGSIGGPPDKKPFVNGKHNNRSPRELKKALQAHYKRKVHLEGVEFAKTNPPKEDEETIRLQEEMRKYIESNRSGSKATSDSDEGAEESKAGEPAPLTEIEEDLLKIAIYNKGIVKPPTGSKENFKANSRRLESVGATNHSNSVIEQYKRQLKEGVKNGDWENDFIKWGIDSDDWEVKKKLIVPMNGDPEIYGDWSDFIEYYTDRVGQQVGNGMRQLGARLYEPAYRPSQQLVEQAQREQIGKGHCQNGGEIIDTNVDLIGEFNDFLVSNVGSIFGGSIGMTQRRQVQDIERRLMRGRGGPGYAELVAINSVLYPLQPKLPGLNTETGMPVPPSTPFDFLNF